MNVESGKARSFKKFQFFFFEYINIFFFEYIKVYYLFNLFMLFR